MITSDDILNMNFYKKETFTGSYKGMRYRIKKDTQQETDVFCVCIWQGPYNFASTDDAKKIFAHFPFTPEGKQQAVDWMNDQWNSRTEWHVC